MSTDDSPALEAASLARLRQFVLLDVATALIAATVMSFVNLLFVQDGWLTVATLMVVAAGTTMAAALRPLSTGDATAAVMWLSAGNWGIAVGAGAIATFSWPVQSLAALLPAVVAVPYVSRARYRLILAVSVGVSVLAAGLGLLQDVTGLTDDLPEWIPPTILVMFMPFMAVLMSQGGASAAAILRELLDTSLAANEQLRASEESLARHAELLRQSRARVVAAGNHERRRIERDLHDGAQQRLVALGLQISLARAQCADDPAQAQATLDKMRVSVRRAQDEMRSLVRGLHPPVLTQHGLAPAVRAAVAQLDGPRRDEISDVGRLDPGLEAALYFCCVEALQNTMKHTPPDSLVTVTLRLDGNDGGVLLAIEDDGPGFEPGDQPGSGLTNLTDRIGAVGGSLEISSAPGEGTRISARVSP